MFFRIFSSLSIRPNPKGRGPAWGWRWFRRSSASTPDPSKSTARRDTRNSPSNSRFAQALRLSAASPRREDTMSDDKTSKTLAGLVVDDEAGFRRMLEWELTNRGMNVETAENGVEGVQRAREKNFDVIITDITMPQMDGLKLL